MNTSIVPNTRSRVILNLPQGVVSDTAPSASRHEASASAKRQAASRTPTIRFKHLLAGALLASVVGCGTTSGDRAISGAGIGAGAGAVLGTVTGMGPGTGAAIGAAAGAATGGLTKKKQINLGKPLWR